MRGKEWYWIIAGLFMLAGCERREPNEPQRNAATFFGLGTPACHGGDVCRG